MLSAAVITVLAGALLSVVGNVGLVGLFSVLLVLVSSSTGIALSYGPWLTASCAFGLISLFHLGYIGGLVLAAPAGHAATSRSPSQGLGRK